MKKEFPDAWEDGAVVDVEDDNQLDGEVADPLGGKNNDDHPDGPDGPDGPRGGGFGAAEAAVAMMVA